MLYTIDKMAILCYYHTEPYASEAYVHSQTDDGDSGPHRNRHPGYGTGPSRYLQAGGRQGRHLHPRFFGVVDELRIRALEPSLDGDGNSELSECTVSLGREQGCESW